jgi:vacuolar-type H+-ATPase subunit E/Vma4
MTKPMSEERRAYLKAYREQNKERIAAQGKEYRRRTAEHRKEYVRRHYEENGNAIKTRMKEYRSRPEVREAERQYMQEYRERNREKIRQKDKERYRNDLQYRLKTLLRNRLGCAVISKAKSGSAVRDLGCTIDEFIAYISQKFEYGMTWDNWGEWHLDHIVPLSSFDLTDREQFKTACHYTNMQPLWAVDNMSKKDRVG